MKPYVLLAERLGYVVNVVEPWEICAKQLGQSNKTIDPRRIDRPFWLVTCIWSKAASAFFFFANGQSRHGLFVKSSESYDKLPSSTDQPDFRYQLEWA